MIGSKYLNLKLFGDKRNSGINGNSNSFQNVHNISCNENNNNNDVENENNKKVANRNSVEENKRFYRDKRIIHEGWLNKYTNLIGSYRPRYFVLENGILRYSIDKFSPTKETFVLSHCKIRVCPDDPLHFEIETMEQGILYLKADLPEQKHKWYISFKKAQLNYIHGNLKKTYTNINSFNNASKNASILGSLIKNANTSSEDKPISYDIMSSGGVQSDTTQSNLGQVEMLECDFTQEEKGKENKKDKKENIISNSYFTESDFNKIYDFKKMNFDEIFISCTDFEEKNPILCLMENIVSLKEVMREIIKNSEYEKAKKFLCHIKSADSSNYNLNQLSSYLLKLTNSVEYINVVVEKYISCSEMLLKEENIQTKCINKSLKLLAKQNYFLEQSQQNDLLGNANSEVTRNLEKIELYESEPESEDMFFDCDETFTDNINAQLPLSMKRTSLKSGEFFPKHAYFNTVTYQNKETTQKQSEAELTKKKLKYNKQKKAEESEKEKKIEKEEDGEEKKKR